MEVYISPFSIIDSFYLGARVEGISKGRIQNYEIVLKSFSKWLGVKAIEEIRRDDIRGYLLHLEKRKPAKATIALHFDVLQTFFNFCKREDFLQALRQCFIPVSLTLQKSFHLFKSFCSLHG